MPGFGVQTAETSPSYVLGKSSRGNSERRDGKEGPGKQSTQVAKEFQSAVLTRAKELCCQGRLRQSPGWPGGWLRSSPGCRVKLPGCALPKSAWQRPQVRLDSSSHSVHRASHGDAALQPSGGGISL